MNPVWTILIATLGQRRDRFARLLDELLPQVDDWDGLVHVTALYNNGERRLGDVRQALVQDATTEYVSFVDDDDSVPSYHVDYVMTAILDHLEDHGEPVDYVGWRMQCYRDGMPLKPTFHSLRYDRWWDDEDGFYRDVSHLNPIRRQLALRADFRRGEPPEDVSWADQVRRFVKTEAYVDDVMYHYHSSSSDSTWRGNVANSREHRRLVVDNLNFTYHPWS